MFIDGYGFFAACRKIACLVILLAFSSSAQAVFVSTPVNLTFDSPREILTEAGQEHSYVVGRITITDGSTQTQWSLGKGEGELKYGVADFILSLERQDVTTVTMTPATIGQTVFYRYYLVKGPENVPPDKFDVIVQDGMKKTTLKLTVGVYNNPPRVYDSEGEELTVSTSPTSVGTYTATFVVGEVSTTVFSANEERLSGRSQATAPYFTWSIIPNVDSLATVYFANTDGSQFTASPQNTIPGSDVGVVYRSSRDENVSNAGYTLVVRDTLGRAATVTVLLTPKPPVIRHEGSSVEDGELDVSVEELARSFDLSAEYACPSLTPKCLSWSSDSLVVSIIPSPTAGGDTVRVTTPEGTDVGASFPVTVLVSGSMPVSESTVRVTVVEDLPPEIVSIDGQSTRRTFSVSPNLDTVRFSVVAEDDFDPESMIWAIFSAASSGKGTASFVVMDGMMESTATTAKGSNVMVDFKKSTVSSTFRLTVTDSTGLVDTATVTVNPGSTLSVTALEIGLDDSETNIEVTEAEVASRLVLTFRATDSGLGETAALKWSVSTINGLVFDSTNSMIMGSEAELVFRFSPSTSFTTGRFQVQVSNSYDVSYSRTINLVGAKPVGKPPVVTYRIGDASSNFRESSGRTISFPEGVMTAAISFRAYDPNPAGLLPDPVPVDSSGGLVIVIREDTTFTWTIGEQHGLRVFFVDTNKGENVVVRFEEPPVEESYFVIRVTLNGRANTIRVTAAAKATQQLRIRTFLGGAVR